MKRVVSVLLVGVAGWFGSACGADSLFGAGCSKNSDCPPGWACVDKKCEMMCGRDGDPCDDGNSCTVTDTCSIGICMGGTPLSDGSSCNQDGDATTREICLAGECKASICGDGYADLGATPAEECDDGNTASSDGCEWNCSYLPPSLTITFPERGATLDGNSEVLVKGVAADDFHQVTSVKVNGQSATLGSDGTWGYRHTSSYGLNVIEAIATNGVGKTARRTVGFYYSTTYAPYAAPVDDTVKVPDALFMRLSQEAIDDGDHPCANHAGVYSCTEVDDIATLGEITLNNLDLSESVGDLPLYTSSPLNFLYAPFPFVANDIFGSGTLNLSGQIDVTGNLTIKIEAVTLDFNELKLALKSRTGGLDGIVDVSSSGTTPGFTITVRTTVQADLVAAFSTLNATWNGSSIDSLACFLINLASPETAAVICDGAALGEVHPNAEVPSTLAIQEMTLDLTFNVHTAAGGGVAVDLATGTVNFHGSQIDIQPIQNLVINLGTLSIFGGMFEVPLPSIQLGSAVSGLNSVLSAATTLITNALRPLAEAAISGLLLNPSDPLTMGELLKSAIEGVAPNGPLALTPFAGQTAAPQVRVASEITSIVCEASVGTNLLTGGITPGLDTLFFANKVVQRTPKGSIVAADCYGNPEPGPTFPETAALEDAYHVDALNQGLFAVWWNGGFNMPFEARHLATPLPTSLGVTAFTMTPLFYTAPFLGSCAGERLTLQVADVSIAGSFTSAGVRHSFQAFVSAKIPVNIDVTGGKATLTRVNAQPWKFVVEVVSNPAVDPALNSTLESLLQVVLVDEILVRYGAIVMNALPEFKLDLSVLAPTEAAVLQLEALSAQTNAGYTVFRGDVGP
jgi:cysteine-rich repeat protein